MYEIQLWSSDLFLTTTRKRLTSMDGSSIHHPIRALKRGLYRLKVYCHYVTHMYGRSGFEHGPCLYRTHKRTIKREAPDAYTII